MQPTQFDDLARALAHGATRRQVLKSLAVGATASLLSSFGFGARAGGVRSLYAAGENPTYLPIIVTPKTVSICSAASTCDKKLYCSEDQGCRCIQTAEGDIRCGQTPSCAAQRCITSADCANLGEGYFCDSPGSGCCDEDQRCLAPCGAPQPCPAERICGTTCCAEGTSCIDGACIDPTSGTWTGTVNYEGQSIAVQFVLEHSAGALAGRMLMQDPVSKAYLDTGAIEGYRVNDTGVWTTEAGSYVDGEFAGDGFTGTFSFPFRHDEPGFDAAIVLQRTGN